MLSLRVRVLLFCCFLVSGTPVSAEWKPAKAPLMTPWGASLDPAKVWAEYPRPQMVRNDWANLNGLWDYAITKQGDPKPAKWDGKILVPFCVESALSGVGKTLSETQVLWYRRDIDAAAWNGKRVLLHFEAVDWKTTVFVNGKQVGVHHGGFDPFHFDITDALKEGKGELVVRVWDPTDTGSQPLGKQIRNPHGIWYTPVSGIWQTVWMEPAKASHIRSVRFTPDIDKGEVECVVEVANPGDHPVRVQVWFGPVAPSTPVGYGEPGKPIRVKLKDLKLWTPDSPHLVPATIHLDRPAGDGMKEALDWVTSYFAMRKVSFGPDEKGIPRLLLNNTPLFHLGPLDQGWWPDGLLTPPSDEAMKFDLVQLKKLGMNMIRKHIKVEPARYYHYCDTMGFLVWQDMPSAMNRGRKHFVAPGAKTDADDQFTTAEKEQFRSELKAMIDHLRFFPSIYCWVPFNEGWGQHDTNAILKWTKEYDPTRLVNGPSGWEDRGYGDMKDAHIYPGPGMFPVMKDRVSVLGEFGGLGLPVAGHLWKDQGNWGYRTYKTTEELRTHYRTAIAQLHPLIGKGLSAAVYTQTTDVEIEVNGLITYDRKVIKVDVDETAKWHKALFGPPPDVRVLVPTSEEKAQPWKWILQSPAEGWQKPDFDDGPWKTGNGGFGSKGTPGAVIGTEWTTREIWIRRSFELKELPQGEVMLRFHCDEDGEVFLNGHPAAKLPGYTTGYSEIAISPAARASLKPGRNVIAAKAKNALGGQYIDIGLVDVVPVARKK